MGIITVLNCSSCQISMSGILYFLSNLRDIANNIYQAIYPPNQSVNQLNLIAQDPQLC